MELLNPLSAGDFPAKTASFTSTAGNTGTWNSGPEGVLVWADQPCYIAVGQGAVATTSDTPIPANTPVPFKIAPLVSGTWRVSAIAVAGGTGGTLYAKPMNTR